MESVTFRTINGLFEEKRTDSKKCLQGMDDKRWKLEEKYVTVFDDTSQ